MTWPDYLSRESLARRLDMAPGAIDQPCHADVLLELANAGEAAA